MSRMNVIEMNVELSGRDVSLLIFFRGDDAERGGEGFTKKAPTWQRIFRMFTNKYKSKSYLEFQW